jgi:hypothetical protein
VSGIGEIELIPLRDATRPASAEQQRPADTQALQQAGYADGERDDVTPVRMCRDVKFLDASYPHCYRAVTTTRWHRVSAFVQRRVEHHAQDAAALRAGRA